MTAPVFRAVDQHTGEVAPGGSMVVTVREIDEMRTELARVTEQRDGFRAELDNLMDTKKSLGSLVAALTSQCAHWHADRDEAYDRADEWRDKAERYLATIDELQAEVRWLTSKVTVAESERDTANVKASL